MSAVVEVNRLEHGIEIILKEEVLTLQFPQLDRIVRLGKMDETLTIASVFGRDRRTGDRRCSTNEPLKLGEKE